MATLGVVNYGETSPHKLNILQQSPITNSVNVDNNKRQIIFLRKPSKSLEPSNANNLLTNTSGTQRKAVKDMTRIHNPPPIAVARRNARERNRVKQVNNGFATLRQHIPTSIAATYESGSGRGSNKKLSKVETLRMAVEYIKSLEKLLSFSEENGGIANKNFTSSQTYVTSTSPSSTQSNMMYTYQSQLDDDETSSVGSSRHPSKSSYHLINSHMYEDEENMHPSTIEGMDDDLLQESSLVNTNMKLADTPDISLLHSIDNNASLSPEMYSEHSLSPAEVESLDSKSFIPVFNVPDQNILPSFSHIGYERLPQIKSELLSPNATQTVIDADMQVTSEPQTLCVITRNEVTDSQTDMIQDVIWWDQQQQRS